MVDQGLEPGLPEVAECFRHLIDYLFEVGPDMQTGMGATPLTHGELRAWQDNTGLGLEPWEANMLRRLSAEWIAERHRAEDPSAPAPYQVALPSREDVARKIDEFL